MSVDEVTERLSMIKNVRVVKFERWEKEDVVYGKDSDKSSSRNHLAKKEEPFEQFCAGFIQEMNEFKMHASRVAGQYAAIQELKQRLSVNHATIQMDFAENFTCHYMEEVQSAYYNKSQVTIHPMVVHYKNADGNLDHKSFVGISPDRSHTATQVFGFIKKLVGELKQLLPTLTTVHYLTDSPTSQYRNRSIFNIIAHHRNMFGLDCSWQFFEAGHGKGPCDGVGGAVKRNATTAIKKGITIQGAADFYRWGVTQTASLVKYTFLDEQEVEQAEVELDAMKAVAVKGTIKIHSVTSVREGQVYVRNISCMKPCCFTVDGKFVPSCAGWTMHKTCLQEEDQLHQESYIVTKTPLLSSLAEGTTSKFVWPGIHILQR